MSVAAASGSSAASERTRSPAGARRSLMSALIGAEEYALPLDRIHEVIPYGGLTRVPTAPAFVPGLVSLYGAAVPVLDLSRKLEASKAPGAEQRSIVVVQIRIRETPTLVGIAIDRLGRVLHLTPDEILPPPPLQPLIGVEFLTGVLHGRDGLVLCVDVDRLLGADEAEQVAELSLHAVRKPTTEPPVARIPYLCVRLAGERCVVALMRLREITHCGALARVPGAAPYVLGATNIRGSIVPVVDVGRRYGLAATPHGPSSGLLLVEVGGDDPVPVGMLVESIERLVQVPAHEVNRTPPFGTRFPSGVVLGLAPVEQTFVAILDTDLVLAEERVSMSQPSASPAQPAP